MSFRIEEKISVSKYESIKFIKFLESKGLKKIYDDRLINSIYFDNIDLSMFYHSEEGVRPRQKIRIRSYNNQKKYYLEKKISADEGRYKLSKLINDIKYLKYLKNGFFSNIYGICYPLVIVSYKRSYFELNDVRITYDYNINYKNFITLNNKFIETRRVFEIKCSNLSDTIEINNLLGPKNRFSKYSESIIKLNIN